MVVEKTGTDEEQISLEDNSSLAVLKEKLLQKHPSLSELHFTFAINMEIVTDNNTTLNDNDEVGLLPAFAGG